MFIKKEDFKYMESLIKGLDEAAQERFLKLLTKRATAHSGEDLLKAIQVVGDEILDERAVEASEWVTRTIIKKVYKEAKQG